MQLHKQTYKMKKYLFIIALILLIPLAIYIYYFHNHPIGDPIDWSYFGDFYGGVLTPLITAITTLLLIYITITISKRGETYQKEILFTEYRKNVLSDIMKYQRTLNYTKSRLTVREILVKSKITSIRDEYDKLSYQEKKKNFKKDYERQNNEEIVLALRMFFADIIYDISEIVKYFEYFNINQSLLFEKLELRKSNIELINKELSILNNLLQECMIKGEIVIPENLESIEKEISKLTLQISDIKN